jgi:hypothetical protein
MDTIAAFQLAVAPNQPQSTAVPVANYETRSFAYTVIGAATYFRSPEAGVGSAY